MLITILSVILLSYPKHVRLVKGNCISSQNDIGASYIKQLHSSINNAACQLVEDITYNSYNVTDAEEFDFIVIGAGSAGAVVANRLSENPAWNVLLLEAGGDPTISAEIPNLFMSTINSSIDWKYQTEPEPTNCLGMIDKSCTWPRGKALGGTSAINAMLYVRGHPNDFDGWENMGNYGWKYKYILPFFKKSEDLRSNYDNNEDFYRYHGKGGNLIIESFKDDIDPFIKTFSKAFEELRMQSFSDVNAENHEGYFTLQGTLSNGRKCSTARAFLYKFQTRPNLKISKHSFVNKILINNMSTAYGVEFKKGKQTFKATARKEVILSGGSINSPQLLLLSGIGPQEHLKQLGIKVVQDLQVGFNLQDHIMMRGFIVTLNITVPPSDPLENMYQFLINSKGNLAGVGLFSTTAFIRTRKASYPNIQFLFAGFPPNSTAGLREAMSKRKFNDIILRSVLNINYKSYTVLIIPSLLRPRSRGRVLLRSNNPKDTPLIYPGYFSVEDVDETVEAIKFASKLIKTGPMKYLGAKLERIDIPGCEPYKYLSKSFWQCVVKHMSVSGDHSVGSCKMGPRNSSSSVVDPRLRVIGINNLRVVDASVMPTITSGNTNAPIIAIAEKASDMIKQFWRMR